MWYVITTLLVVLYIAIYFVFRDIDRKLKQLEVNQTYLNASIEALKKEILENKAAIQDLMHKANIDDE